jgi:hypothetical protein
MKMRAPDSVIAHAKLWIADSAAAFGDYARAYNETRMVERVMKNARLKILAARYQLSRDGNLPDALLNELFFRFPVDEELEKVIEMVRKRRQPVPGKIFSPRIVRSHLRKLEEES